MEIRLADDSDKTSWDNFADNFNYPPLNRYCWKEILRSSYNVETFFFKALGENKTICGILPTYVTRDLNNNKRMYSLRFGLVATVDDVKKRLISYVQEFCGENNIISSLITSGYEKAQTGFQEIVKKTVVVDIGKTEEETWKLFKDKTRNLIRKSIKSGLTAEKGFNNLKEFYGIYASNMADKGIPALSFDFFNNLVSEMKDGAELVCARKDGRIIGGIVVLFSKGIAIYPFQACLKNYRKYAPNQFLIWEAMRSCVSRNIPLLDMGESSIGGEVYLFKTNFGGSPKDIFYYSAYSAEAPSRAIPAGRLSIASFAHKILSVSPFVFRNKLGIWIKSRERII